MPNTEFFSKKVVSSGSQFEKDGFAFLDPTEHLMPKNETAIENQSAFIARHKKIFSEQVVRPQGRWFGIFQLKNLTFDEEAQKPCSKRS